MPQLLLTLAISFIIVILAFLVMAIGWILTGKSKIQPGACGRDPTQRSVGGEDCDIGMSCQLCKTADDRVICTPSLKEADDFEAADAFCNRLDKQNDSHVQ